MLRDPAQLLPLSSRSSLAAVWVDGSDDGHGWDGYVIRYEPTAPITGGDLGRALIFAEAILEPAGPVEIAKELGRLRTLTASREVGQDNLELVIAAYTHELQRYPLDAAREVLRSIARAQKFWPTISEIVERLDRLVKPRHALRRALRQPYVPSQPSPDWIPPPTDEQKEEVLAMLRAHGIELDQQGRILYPAAEPMTAADLKRVQAETRGFRLVPEDDPSVLALLREMGA